MKLSGDNNLVSAESIYFIYADAQVNLIGIYSWNNAIEWRPCCDKLILHSEKYLEND